jgi:malonyl CoA-acyl carrier protein transacylase
MIAGGMAAVAAQMTQETGWMEQATRLAAQAEAALEAGRAKEASRLYDEAIDVIGTRYQRTDTFDDTSMRLILSGAEAGKGDWNRAANLKRSVAETRLALARQR